MLNRRTYLQSHGNTQVQAGAGEKPSRELKGCWVVRSYLPSVADASRMAEFPAAGTPAGTVVVRAAGLRVHGMTVTAAGRCRRRASWPCSAARS